MSTWRRSCDSGDLSLNAAIVILEACHTGTLVPILADPHRLIISSTDENDAYYEDGLSFIELYFAQLRQPDTFLHAFEEIKRRLPTKADIFQKQNPK